MPAGRPGLVRLDRGLALPTVTIDGFLVGAWTRSRLVVDGAQCRDRCEALWLQTADWYADMRTPRHFHSPFAWGPESAMARPRAFAGTATWQPPVMSWRHQLDYLGDPITDSIPLERQGDLLIEAGSLRWAGLAVPFREEWQRISQPHDEISAEVSARRIQITIGVWRILIVDDRPEGAFRASMLTRTDGTWRMLGKLTEPPDDDETGRFGLLRRDARTGSYEQGGLGSRSAEALKHSNS